MLKRVLAGASLTLMLVGPAFAHEGAHDEEGAVASNERHTEEPPGPASVPGPPPVEAPEAKVEVEYKVGVTGFMRGEGVGNFTLSDFSHQPGHSEGRFLYRVKPYVFWHPTDYLDFHLEGQGYGFTGSGRDKWEPSFYQGYVEAKLPGSDLLALKAGRQEFSYGSNFMLGPDGFYNGLTFDGGRLRVQPTDSLSIDFLGGYYAGRPADGVKGNIAGAYATLGISDGNAVEGYFLRDTGSTERHSGEELDSVGLRATGKYRQLSLEVEPVYQFGDTYNASKGGNEDISAFGWHADLTADLEAAGKKHKIWLGYAYGSGSRGSADGTTSRYEFRNPNNDTAIVGDMSVFGDLSGVDVGDHHASGLEVYTLGWGVDLTNSLNFSATGHYFRADAVQSGFSRELGLETDFTLTYNISENFSLLLAYDHLFTGSFFKKASGSGDDIHYGYAMLQFNLEKVKAKGNNKGA